MVGRWPAATFSLTDADGAVHKSEAMTLDNEFTHIIAETLRSRYPDGSFFTAKDGDIKTESLSVFDGSRFSACNCDFEKVEPIWDLRATSTRHDVTTGTIVHRKCPYAYPAERAHWLPSLSGTPGLTVRRRSGFLTPTLVMNTDLGFVASIPTSR